MLHPFVNKSPDLFRAVEVVPVLSPLVLGQQKPPVRFIPTVCVFYIPL